MSDSTAQPDDTQDNLEASKARARAAAAEMRGAATDAARDIKDRAGAVRNCRGNAAFEEGRFAGRRARGSACSQSAHIHADLPGQRDPACHAGGAGSIPAECSVKVRFEI